MITSLSIGKIRGLQQCSTENGAIVILALDHRNNLRRSLIEDHPELVTDEQLIAFKQEVTKALAPYATATLLDPQFGAGQCIASGALPGNAGLVVAIEATGYAGDTDARQSRLLPGWSVKKAQRMGASAVKLLVYYHPNALTASQIEDLVCSVAEECLRQDILLLLEPLSYSLDPNVKKISPEERTWVVTETAKRLVVRGVDVLKAEFPIDIEAEPDTSAWARACRELTGSSLAPWVLLSASVPFETFLRQTTIACNSGASGVAVGRAVWREATALKGDHRQRFLQETASVRMGRIKALCTALARPWSDYYQAEIPRSNWFEHYGER